MCVCVCVCVCDWITLMYTWNNVSQLTSIYLFIFKSTYFDLRKKKLKAHYCQAFLCLFPIVVVKLPEEQAPCLFHVYMLGI